MPRDMLRLLLQETVRAEQDMMTGTIASQVILLPYDVAGIVMPTAHVIMNTAGGIKLVCHIPIAQNNQELRHAVIGSPVQIQRSRTGRLEIVGLAKRDPGTVLNYTMNLSTASMISGNVSALSAHAVTLGELASVTSVGFGQTPLAAVGIFNFSGTFVTFA